MLPGRAYLAGPTPTNVGLLLHAAQHVTDLLQTLLQRWQLRAGLVLGSVIADVLDLHFKARHLDHQIVAHEQWIYGNGSIHFSHLA